MERENDLRKNEIRSLEEKQQKDNQVSGGNNVFAKSRVIRSFPSVTAVLGRTQS